jgi:hypothetical protein
MPSSPITLLGRVSSTCQPSRRESFIDCWSGFFSTPSRQQKLFIAARELPEELHQVEHQFQEQIRAATSSASLPADEWASRLSLATTEVLGLIPVNRISTER